MLLDDPGTSVYGIPAHLGWYKTTLAHNTFVQSETNQKPATGKLLALKTGDGWSAALADAGPVYEGARLQRAAFLLGSDTAIFIDTVEQKAPASLDLAIHPSFEPKAWVEQAGSPYPSTNSRPGYSYLKDLKQLPSFSSYVDGSGFQLTVLPLNTATSFLSGTGMGKSSEDRVPILLVRTEAQNVRWVWAIAPKGTELTARTEGAAISVVVRTPGKKTWQLRVQGAELSAK